MEDDFNILANWKTTSLSWLMEDDNNDDNDDDEDDNNDKDNVNL